jgi:hypothetical protein
MWAFSARRVLEAMGGTRELVPHLSADIQYGRAQRFVGGFRHIVLRGPR